MENTPALTAQYIKTIRADHGARLLMLAEALIRSAEDLPRPDDQVSVEKHAKTLMAVAKTVDEIHGIAANAGDMDMHDDKHDSDTPQPDTLEHWRDLFERKFDRLMAARTARSLAEQPDDPGLQTPP